MKTDNSCTNGHSETTFFDNDSSCLQEVLDIDKILSENIQNLSSISNNIVISRPICANNRGSNYLEENEHIIAQVRSLMLQKGSKKEKLNNKNIHKEIKQLKEDIQRVSQEIDELQTEREHVKSVGISYEKALDYYTTNFDFKIEMDSIVDENKYWVKLHFGDKAQFPLKFLFNHKTDAIEDFDPHTLLSPEEASTLRNKFYKERDICMVLKLLRALALDKN